VETERGKLRDLEAALEKVNRYIDEMNSISEA
jgi:hypothetical protein